ncbi:MAG: hypothetical protein H0T18_06915 [Chloroflexia bacterium]|nr:hypothetical protein [Chloroflexia bacterium]
MEYREFDRLVRKMATGVSRRSVLRRAAGSAIAAPVTIATSMAATAKQDDKNKDKSKDKNKEKDKGQNQENQSAPVVQTNNQVCAGDNCNQTNQQAVGGTVSQTVIAGSQELLGTPPSYWVDVACTFDAPNYRTVCDCTGRGNNGAPAVQKITLPSADICAFVISEEMRPGKVRPSEDTTIATGGEANAGNGGVANADASGGSVTVGDVNGDDTNIAIDASGGTASADASGGDNNVAIAGGGQISQDAAQVDEFSKLTLTLEGNVVPGRPATYWVDTDTGRRPANGPALVQVAEEPNSTGAIVAEAWLCPIAEPQPDYDWFGQCMTPVTDMAFNLYTGSDSTTPVTTSATNPQGRARFGDLTAGTYKLEPGAALGGDGDIWCYAESDRVDANGNVLVEPDLESHVWSFVCGGPRGS